VGTDKIPAEHVDMIAPDCRRIVQAVGFIQKKMEGLRLKLRTHGAAEKPVYFRKICVLRPRRV
jgi:hypothetical protein